MTEKQLIERCRAGESKALRTLYERYADNMLGICFRYVNDRDTARDLLHDGFVTLFTKIGDFRGEGSFEGWMRRIFVTTCLGYLRKNSNGAAARPPGGSDEPGDPEASVLEQLSATELLKLIGTLPEGYRTVLNLYAIEGYSHREIAELLGISENTSRSQYARAKTWLRKAMQQQDMD